MYLFLLGGGFLSSFHLRAFAHTHTGKTGAGSDSGAQCNVKKWLFSDAAGPAN